jgi:DNA-binding NarL/FixJ family response regulator
MSSSLRIAIADDDRSVRETLLRMLENLGHSVVVIAEDGRSLVDQCASVQPDVVITDNLMKTMSGLDAAADIYRARPTPIVLLSGYCNPTIVRNAEERHILVYLVKPVSQTHLEAALMRCDDQLPLVARNGTDRDVVMVRSYTQPVTDSRFRVEPRLWPPR